MKEKKIYQVSDLFYTSWDQLTAKARTEVYALYQVLRDIPVGSNDYSHHLIQILRRLRKNLHLVNQINEAQTVDIFNELSQTMFDKPWYRFPEIKNMIAPEEQMERHTFDHFIYADNEFTSYMASQDRKYLVQLVCTLYKLKGDGPFLDRQLIDGRAQKLSKKIKDWELKGVLFTYVHIREFVNKRCKTLLPKQTRKDDDVKEVKVVPTGALWLEQKHRLAETAAFQGFDTAGRANMYDALDYLEDIAKTNSKK